MQEVEDGLSQFWVQDESLVSVCYVRCTKDANDLVMLKKIDSTISPYDRAVANFYKAFGTITRSDLEKIIEDVDASRRFFWALTA